MLWDTVPQATGRDLLENTGNEAIEKLRTNRYAAMLLDLRMPNTDGFAVLDFIKRHAPRMLRSVIVVTAALSAPEVARARTYEVCAIVSKPFDVDALLETVKQCAARDDAGPIGGVLYSSGPMIFLLADLLKQHLH